MGAGGRANKTLAGKNAKMTDRYGSAERLLMLAQEMQASRCGMSLADIRNHFGVGSRTAMRMRDAILRVFPQTIEMKNTRPKRWRIPRGDLNGRIVVSALEIDHLRSIERAAHAAANRGYDGTALKALSESLNDAKEISLKGDFDNG